MRFSIQLLFPQGPLHSHLFPLISDSDLLFPHLYAQSGHTSTDEMILIDREARSERLILMKMMIHLIDLSNILAIFAVNLRVDVNTLIEDVLVFAKRMLVRSI